MTICYGMTETSPVSTQTQRRDDLNHRTSTVGRVHPHVEIKIIDPATGECVARDVPVNSAREAIASCAATGTTPSRPPKRSTRRDGCTRATSPTVDGDGYVNIVGRSKDMIIRGGENIYPREIEEFLYSHPLIRDVQVVGVPDARYGEEIAAFVIARDVRRRSTPRRARILSRQDRALQDPALRDLRRRVPDDHQRQDPEIQTTRASNRWLDLRHAIVETA